MHRRLSLLALSLASCGLVGAPLAQAGDAKPGAKVAVMATDEAVAAALAKFKEDWKAKGLKGDDRLSQREFALRELAKHQHAKVVEELASVTRDPDPTLRMIGVIYLGDMTLLPGAAGPKVVAAMKAGKGDVVMLMTCLQSIGHLKYLGARAELKDALRDQSFAVKKAAIDAIGRTGDLRLLREMLEVIGVDLGDDPSAAQDANEGKEVVEEGYSWEGAEASVDTGTAGDGDQKAAEAKVKAQLAANKAAAEKGSKAGGGGDGGGASVGRGGTARSTEELLYPIIAALKGMTGRSFTGPKDLRKWHRENRSDLAEKGKALDEQERAQKSAAK
jgi:hypothetical protein